MWLWSIILTVFLVLFLIGALHYVLPFQHHSFAFNALIKKIPGPRRITFLGSRNILTVTNETFLYQLIHEMNIYKPLMRMDILGSYTIAVIDPNDAEVIMNSRAHITKSIDYDIIHPWLGQGLLTSTGDKWFRHRKILTPAFHFGIVEQYLEIFSRNAKVLIEKFLENTSQPAQVNSLVSLCTLDIICETSMGTRVDAQNGGEKKYVQAVLEMSELFQIRQLSPWMYRESLFNILPTGRRQAKVLDTLHGFTGKVIRTKVEEFRNRSSDKEIDTVDEYGLKKKKSFLDLLIDFSEKEGKLSLQDIQQEVDTFMFEGHDTTSTAVSWVLFELGHNPQIQKKAQEEQDAIFGGSDREPTTADLAEMKYLERVIKETLRLYPSVPIIGRKLEQNVTLSGYEIPAGAGIAIFIYYMHRNPELYPEPEKFDPDRFLTDRIAKRHPYSYIPFSAGPRNCIGQKFALMEEKVILSELLRNCSWKSITAKSDVKLLAELVLRPKQNLLVNFESRKKSQ